ncbi:hypothetical protein Ethha_0942 [Ethanoligenens harbinense YUAN-3]|uniref:Uncharacterized protein n=1 Tax=Ethanoligenens harbinense (strain DSM 18485 / JCM 12961 / CGMCC 1.5033 / YUAN-3) TaxID=663278 RepID=E6U3T2_ETHHY|nr:hypothetical protein Ethha_0942 [Ethanoligenens harbinense YUAN-3]
MIFRRFLFFIRYLLHWLKELFHDRSGGGTPGDRFQSTCREVRIGDTCYCLTSRYEGFKDMTRPLNDWRSRRRGAVLMPK